MKSLLKKTLLAVLPLLGLLLTLPPAALARHHHHPACWSGEERYGYDRPSYEDDSEDRESPLDGEHQEVGEVDAV